MVTDEIEISPDSITTGLGDYTWIDADRDGLQGADESPLADVTVNLFYVEDKTTAIDSTLTDQNGYYEFIDLDPERAYFVQFDASSVTIDGSFLLIDAGNGASIGSPDDSDADPLTGCTDTIDLDLNEFDASIDAGFYCESCVLDLQVRLQGASNADGGLMDDDLRVSTAIPLEQPFGKTKHNYLGTETINQDVLDNKNENSIVEWILIGLRERPDSTDTDTTTTRHRAALLQRDGDIVDLDGESKIYVGDMIEDMSGDYYICVEHRNHMGVMTADPINIADGVAVDFSDINTPTFGEYAQVEAGGKREMWCGEVSGDNQVIFQGANNDPNSIFFEVLTDPLNVSGLVNFIRTEYSISDLNLDNKVIYQGNNNDTNAIFFNVLFHPKNINLSPSFILQEQLPE